MIVFWHWKPDESTVTVHEKAPIVITLEKSDGKYAKILLQKWNILKQVTQTMMKRAMFRNRCNSLKVKV